MSHRAAILSLVVLALATTARASDQGSPEERDACGRDTVKYCKGVAPEDGPMLNCLLTNRVKISASCREALERHGM